MQVTLKPIAAFSFGSTNMMYKAIKINVVCRAYGPHSGSMKKSSFKILETEWASMITGGIVECTGVEKVSPIPSAVTPISTILLLYFFCRYISMENIVK